MDAPRLNVSPRMRELLRYDKLAGPVPRILILESNYWLDDACRNAARELGWAVESVPIVQEGYLPREVIARLFTILGEFRPDFVLSINMGGMDVQGLFARFFEDVGIPLVTWFVDDPRTILVGRAVFASTHTVALTWEAAYIEDLHRLGFPIVHVLPLAVDATVFNAPPLETTLHAPAFVGNSMISYARREWALLAEYPGLVHALEAAFEAGRVTRERFGKGLDAILDPEHTNGRDPEASRHAEMLCFVEGTRRLRAELVAELLPEGLVVRGDEEWRELAPGAQGSVNYRRDLPAFYRACEVNLNVTSIQMATTVNQRVFDCPAAGGFLLTDAQSALAELFAPDEVAVYATWDECRELLAYYRGDAGARRELVKRAQMRIFSEHTYAHRLHTIVDLVRRHYA
jgi:spore maturation protein CgeB